MNISKSQRDIVQNTPVCYGKNQADFACRDQKCKKLTYFCSNQSCICQKLHRHCDEEKQITIHLQADMIEQKIQRREWSLRNCKKKALIQIQRQIDLFFLISAVAKNEKYRCSKLSVPKIGIQKHIYDSIHKAQKILQIKWISEDEEKAEMINVMDFLVSKVIADQKYPTKNVGILSALLSKIQDQIKQKYQYLTDNESFFSIS